MRTNIRIVIFFLFSVIPVLQNANAQSWDWAKAHIHSAGNVNACVWPQDLGIDASNNIVTTGYYAGISTDAVSFDGITANGYGSAFHYTGYVCKHNSSGTVLWAQRFGSGGTTQDGNVQGICVSTDASGNVYVAGNFSRDCRFGGSLTANSGGTVLTSVYGDDGFIAKYSSAGTFQWVKQIASSTTAPQGSESVKGIEVTTSGIYVTGTFNGRTNFGGTYLTSTMDGASYSTDVFIAKYDLSGNLVWVRLAGSNKTDYSTGISADASDNFYVFGDFQSTATFGSFNVTSGGGAGSTISNPYLAKYNNAGTCQWVKTGYSTTSISNYYLTTQPPAVDAFNNIYISGSIPAGASINWGSNLSNASSYSTIYCTKLNSSGTHQWSQQFASSGNIYSGTVSAIGGTTLNIAGNFVGTAPFSGFPQTSTSNSSVFVLRLNQSTGVPIFSKRIYGTSLTSYVPSLGTLSSGELIVGGLAYSISNPMYFDAGILTLQRSTGYIAKLGYSNLPVELIQFDATCGNHGPEFNWSTATETQSHNFSLQIFRNESWDNIATIPAAGNSNSIQKYSFDCSDCPKGENYYQLIQSDFDGTINEQGIVVVNCSNEPGISIFPNPASDRIIVSMTNIDFNNAEFIVTDATGRVIPVHTEKNETEIHLNINDIAPGAYTIFCISGEQKVAKTFLKY
ncbi:MAG: hypothetical protein CVU11_15510 [Bacteroidetes bacterium HGW-Bacteroidetes-6]|jgi:hypothetical protein|nr:MAG: hypothetical protein CVU11_15510 [Bacteroidetes bacterium HGW-Bacteroidetes-6]